MSKPKAVIGIGNTLRRDDGVGILVLDRLVKRYAKVVANGRSPLPDFFDFGTASFDLVHKLERYTRVLIIDAVDCGNVPGEVRIFSLEEAVCEVKEGMTSTHELDLKGLFELVRRFDIKTEIVVAGIQVEDVSFGEGLSAAVEGRLPEIVKTIEQYIKIM
ncbi:MAG: hydrogenase maturation protease [Candidatus Omnitrophica bacterium]|nr:hydrogenase maturation protease [Candidatus Omnitrophota bacterium]